MNQDFKSALAHVLWIGGATDAGKTTVAQIIAARHGWSTYHYDPKEPEHVERLAKISQRYRKVLTMQMDTQTLDEMWVEPTAEEMMQRMLQTFQSRFLLAIEDLIALNSESFVVAEGFGFTPELVLPLLSHVHQAIWLTPTEDFKWASMQRRSKPYFRDLVSDPERGVKNFFERDMLLAKHVTAQAQKHGLKLCIVDGSHTTGVMAAMIEAHFEPYLPWIN